MKQGSCNNKYAKGFQKASWDTVLKTRGSGGRDSASVYSTGWLRFIPSDIQWFFLLSGINVVRIMGPDTIAYPCRMKK